MDKFEMIKQFKDLLDNGVITQEEFDQKKKELLSIGDYIQPQSVCKPPVEASINDVSVPEKSETDVTETDEKAELANVVEVTEPAGVVEVTEVEPQLQALAPEQKVASKKGKIIIGIVAALVVLLFIGILGSGGSGGIKGSWNCSSVVYQGEKLDASDAQADDYTLKFTDSTFEANIYGAQASGTYEKTDTMTLDDGMEVDIYTLTANGGAELTVAYYKSENVITLSPFGGVSSTTFIEFKRR